MHALRFWTVVVLMTGSGALTNSTFAQANPSAGGSCGYTDGQYELQALAPPPWSHSVGRAYWQARYDSVSPGSQVKVVIFYNDELESFVGSSSTMAVSSAGELTGSFGVGGELGGSSTSKESLRANHGGLWSGNSSGQSKHKAGDASAGEIKDGNSAVAGRAGMYYFYAWNGDQLIGWWRCAVLDA
jgi:hypothetical protein